MAVCKQQDVFSSELRFANAFATRETMIGGECDGERIREQRMGVQSTEVGLEGQ